MSSGLLIRQIWRMPSIHAAEAIWACTHNVLLTNSTWLIEDTTSADWRMWADWSHHLTMVWTGRRGNGLHQSFRINIVNINTHSDAEKKKRKKTGPHFHWLTLLVKKKKKAKPSSAFHNVKKWHALRAPNVWHNLTDIIKWMRRGENTPSDSHTGSNETCFKELHSDERTTRPTEWGNRCAGRRIP